MALPLYTHPMDELEIGGKKYISSKRASELTGYAKDYIGQLARGGKIDATRVGRAWYVDQESLFTHAHDDEAVSRPLNGTSEITSGTKAHIPAIPVVPEIKKSLLSLAHLRLGAFEVPKTWDQVKYHFDENPLFPILIETKAPETTFQTIVFPRKTTEVPEITNKTIVFPRKTTEAKTRVERFTGSPAVPNIDGVVVKKMTTIVGEKIQIQKLQNAAPARKSEKADVQASLPSPLELKGSTGGALRHIAVVSLLVILAISLGGSFLGSKWTMTKSSLAATITADGGAEIIGKGLTAFQEGLEGIKSFFEVIVASFWDFFRAGANFILTVLNLG